MKILLLGEYSNVHWTLAEGLRALGHEVTVVSNGDEWKNYPRDIDLSRDPRSQIPWRKRGWRGWWGGVSYSLRLLRLLPRLKHYDVVQLINPCFFDLKAERHQAIYRYLRKHNGSLVMGAFGLDYYWAQVNTELRPMRYSDFNLGDEVRHDEVTEAIRTEYVGSAKETLCRAIASDCDAIVAGLYEYFVTYQLAENGVLAQKTHYIPMPIDVQGVGDGKEESAPETELQHLKNPKRLSIFLGISKGRSVYKGTDIMLRAAQDVQSKYPDKMELLVAEGVPFAQYQKMIEQSDVLIDQLYGYAPAMNALLAMSKGMVTVGGGEPEHYNLLQETELRPIINVEPNYQSVYDALEHLVLHPEMIPELKRQSIAYVRRHHDHVKVARQYEQLYASLSHHTHA